MRLGYEYRVGESVFYFLTPTMSRSRECACLDYKKEEERKRKKVSYREWEENEIEYSLKGCICWTVGRAHSLAIVPTSSWRRFGYARARDIAEKVTVSSVNLLMIWIFSSLLLRSNNNHYLNLSFFFLSFFLFRNFISHVVRFLLMFSTFKRKPLIFLWVIIFTAPPPPP